MNSCKRRKRLCMLHCIDGIVISAEAKKKSVFVCFVDKDSGVELLKEKFPESVDVTVHENKEKEKWSALVLTCYCADR